MIELVKKLYETEDLTDDELKQLIETDNAENLAVYADRVRQKHYGKKVFLRVSFIFLHIRFLVSG